MQPLVSIVMPSLNQVAFIEQALRSVLKQSHSRIEIVVADGGSSDGTLDLLQRMQRRDPRLRWFSEADTGPANAVNKALQQVRGTYIGWLNADDLYTEGAIKRAVQALQSQSHWLMVYGHGEHIDQQNRVLNLYPTLPPQSALTRFSDGCFICQPTVFFKRALWVIIGRLDETLKTAFDFEYWLRVFTQCPGRIGFIDAVQAQSRLHEDCITVKMRHAVILESMQVIARYLGYAPGHWLLTYTNEMQAATKQPENVRQDIDEMLHKAASLIRESEFRCIRQQLYSTYK